MHIGMGEEKDFYVGFVAQGTRGSTEEYIDGGRKDRSEEVQPMRGFGPR